jgi:GNAT superfamily N-acetyltransferase
LGGIRLLYIRKAKKEDAESLKDLYFHHLTAYPPAEEQNMEKWREMITGFEKSNTYHLLVGEVDGKIVSSVTLVIIENLTHNLRPYAIIENVVTHADYRGKYFATALMKKASEIAKEHNCYKIMLMTGSKRETTLKFYENCGYNKNDKTAFLQRL